jgi:large repetitive protein
MEISFTKIRKPILICPNVYHPAVLTVFVVLILLSISTAMNGQASPCAAGQTGGVAWQDSNGNGIQEAGETQGVAGITVNAYSCTGALIGTTTTNAQGQYTFGVLSPAPSVAAPVRVEFSGWSSALYVPTANGTDGRTDVQFITAPECDVDFGLVNPDSYCQSNPLLVVPCYFSGPQNNALPAMVGVYNNTPESATPPEYGLVNDNIIGTTYGLAYQRNRGILYASAMTRHYFDYGPGGFDAIYPITVSDPNNDAAPTPTAAAGTAIDLSSLGVNMGTNPRSVPLSGSAPYNDGTVYQQVGKIGIGDIDISTLGDTLFVINLNSAAPSLVLLNVANPGAASLIAEIPIPNPGCTGGSFAPWAVKYYQGKPYIGGVCTAETSGTVADLDAYVYRWDGGMTFTQVATMDMNYPRGAATYRADDTYSSAAWRPWTNTWNPAILPLSPNDLVSQPQPILQDIEFLADGSMVLGFGDRFAYQTAFGNRRYDQTTGSTYFTPVAAGDVIKFCNVSGTLVKEATAGSCVQTIDDLGSINIPAIPDFKEFFDDNYINQFNTQAGHSEVALGGLAVVPGTNNFLAVTFDPIRNQGTVNSSGIRTLNNSGTYNKGWVLVTESDNDNNRKGGSLGDIEALCNMVPIEIGNYVWVDTDSDGTQDPCEPPLSGVKVELYKKDGTLIGQTTTGANGEYYFNAANVDTLNFAATPTTGFTGLSPNTQYYIVLGKNMSQFNTTLMTLTVSGTTKYTLTDANSGEGASPDLNDSEGTLLSGLAGGAAALNGFPGYLATTPPQGSNHTFDFGFQNCIPMVVSITPAPAACFGGATGSVTVALTSVGAPFSYDWNGTPAGDGTATITNLTAGTYTVTITNVNGCTTSTSTAINSTYALNKYRIKSRYSLQRRKHGFCHCPACGRHGSLYL